MSGDSHKRIRNRWGTAPASSTSSARPPPPAVATSTSSSTPAVSGNSVSDEDALRALLSETAAKAQQPTKREYQPKRPGQQRWENNDRYDPNSNNSKRPRWSADEKQRGAKDTHNDDKNNYYGPAASSNEDRRPGADGAVESSAALDVAADALEKKRPDFGLSGALAKDQSGTGGSNVYKGVLLKFQEPPEARTPNTLWRLYVFRGDEQIDTLHVSKQSAYLFARNEDIADILLQHPSCSSQHAVLQYRAVPSKETGKLTCQPYLMDLESTNGSFINGVRIDPARYYQLKKGDVLKFGASTREYVLLTANTKSVT